MCRYVWVGVCVCVCVEFFCHVTTTMVEKILLKTHALPNPLVCSLTNEHRPHQGDCRVTLRGCVWKKRNVEKGIVVQKRVEWSIRRSQLHKLNVSGALAPPPTNLAPLVLVSTHLAIFLLSFPLLHVN